LLSQTNCALAAGPQRKSCYNNLGCSLSVFWSLLFFVYFSASVANARWTWISRLHPRFLHFVYLKENLHKWMWHKLFIVLPYCHSTNSTNAQKVKTDTITSDWYSTYEKSYDIPSTHWKWSSVFSACPL